MACSGEEKEEDEDGEQKANHNTRRKNAQAMENGAHPVDRRQSDHERMFE
jgi:hypothetical protein